MSTRFGGKSPWLVGERLLLGGTLIWMSASPAQLLRLSHIVEGMVVLSVVADGLGTIYLGLDLSTFTSHAWQD